MMLLNLNYKEVSEVLLKSKPMAIARVRGSSAYPNIKGKVLFYQTPMGVVVESDVTGLPPTKTNIFAFHIHEGHACSGNATDPFADALEHYNPVHVAHPMHAGDLPPLFSNNGRAWMAVLTDRFEVNQVIGRVVIIHDNPDDFTTQPSGNAGTKIACGVIEPNRSL